MLLATNRQIFEVHHKLHGEKNKQAINANNKNEI